MPASGKGQAKQYHSFAMAAITGRRHYYAPDEAGAKKDISLRQSILCFLPLSENLFMVFGQHDFIILNFVDPAERNKVVLAA